MAQTCLLSSVIHTYFKQTTLAMQPTSRRLLLSIQIPEATSGQGGQRKRSFIFRAHVQAASSERSRGSVPRRSTAEGKPEPEAPAVPEYQESHTCHPQHPPPLASPHKRALHEREAWRGRALQTPSFLIYKTETIPQLPSRALGRFQAKSIKGTH